MKRLEVEYLDSAISDLELIYLVLRERGATGLAARRYVDHLRSACENIGGAPEGARVRNDLVPGLRLWPVERRATIAYKLMGRKVVVVNVFRRGRDLASYYSGQGT